MNGTMVSFRRLVVVAASCAALTGMGAKTAKTAVLPIGGAISPEERRSQLFELACKAYGGQTEPNAGALSKYMAARFVGKSTSVDGEKMFAAWDRLGMTSKERLHAYFAAKRILGMISPRCEETQAADCQRRGGGDVHGVREQCVCRLSGSGPGR